MYSTQQHLPIADINQNLLFLKNGSVTTVLSTSAVNFGLLFETEQMAIIQSFAGLLNSLSFPIQIIIRSKKLDVSSYLGTLDRAAQKQTNLKLSQMTSRYRQYVGGLIQDNEVLDKQFYVCISVTSAELGLLPSSDTDKIRKVLTVLVPRVDHLARQLSRIGLKARVLDTIELTKLFYDIYNPEDGNDLAKVATPLPNVPVNTPPKVNLNRIQPAVPVAPPQTPIIPNPTPTPVGIPPQSAYQTFLASNRVPFVVEELRDDLHT
ncbi:MAG: hypothetical protein Q7S88_03560 [Candidatus Daviesbacteria bacterium]|nr:hypothetical protein [Candidatus Daviesbacteria bacterium]